MGRTHRATGRTGLVKPYTACMALELIKQSYGIQDFKYLRLKIHDLPSRRIKTHI